MEGKAAGHAIWAAFLVLFPVAAQLSSARCVTYAHRETCGLEGSSVQFPCSYPNNSQVISIPGWSKKLHPNVKPKPLIEMAAYSFRMKFLQRGNNDCTMTLTDLKTDDASIYYFLYKSRNNTGEPVTCQGFPGVRLHIFGSPVSILVKELVREQHMPVADLTVTEGQRIMLTCVPNCAANLNSKPGYIWYKNRNRLQLNVSRTNSCFLLLDPISDEDTGSYVCAMIGYEDRPSSAVDLIVKRRPRNIVVSEAPDGGSQEDSVTNKDKSMFTFSMLIVASVCIGWVIVVMVVIPIIRVKKKKKMERKRFAASVPTPQNHNSDLYIALDIKSMSAEYDTLDTVRHCADAEAIYENYHQPGNSLR